MPRTRNPYPAEFRDQMIALARAGRSVESLARGFEPCAATIADWIRKAGIDDGGCCVDVLDTMPFGQIIGVDRLQRIDGGIVDQDIDSACLAIQFSDTFLGRLRIGEIAIDEADGTGIWRQNLGRALDSGFALDIQHRHSPTRPSHR